MAELQPQPQPTRQDPRAQARGQDEARRPQVNINLLHFPDGGVGIMGEMTAELKAWLKLSGLLAVKRDGILASWKIAACAGCGISVMAFLRQAVPNAQNLIEVPRLQDLVQPIADVPAAQAAVIFSLVVGGIVVAKFGSTNPYVIGGGLLAGLAIGGGMYAGLPAVCGAVGTMAGAGVAALPLLALGALGVGSLYACSWMRGRLAPRAGGTAVGERRA